MAIRNNENYNNQSKYSVQDNAERLQAEAEQQAVNDEFDAEQAKRQAIVLNGLVTKYGFTQAGAQQVMNIIARGVNAYTGHCYLDDVKFGSEEKRQAAQNAFNYYWK